MRLVNNPSPDLHPVAARLLILHQIANLALDALVVDAQIVARAVERDDLAADDFIPTGLVAPVFEKPDH